MRAWPGVGGEEIAGRVRQLLAGNGGRGWRAGWEGAVLLCGADGPLSGLGGARVAGIGSRGAGASSPWPGLDRRLGWVVTGGR